jgi:1-acyl-sn-glycerol-3-phosphate acyltransferase
LAVGVLPERGQIQRGAAMMIRAAKNPLGEALIWRLVRGAVTKHFNAVHVALAPAPPPSPLSIENGEGKALPTIYSPNHSNWFDGYLCMVLSRLVLHDDGYLAMDERNLARYRFFTWAGAFGVDRDDGRATLAALDYAADLLRGHPERSIFLFPEGTMLPNERRPLQVLSGAARLAQRVGRVRLVPVAMRYEFLQEQRPDIFIRFGPARVVTQADHPRAITAWLGAAITAELDALTADVIAERLANFTTVLRGRGGIDRTFDRLASRTRRASRRLAHEALGTVPDASGEA